MALKAQSVILYGLEVNATNSSIDFVAVSLGPTLQASVAFGFYSLSSLATAIATAMNQADPANTYSVTVDRTIAGGSQNRVTIETDGTYLDLLFGTGPRAASSIAALIGFGPTDQTGATDYTGMTTAGTILISTLNGYSYLGPTKIKKVFGAVNVSAIGEKEAVVFAVQTFLQVQFKYEPESKYESEWLPFVTWAIQQKLFEFTPEITSPNTYYEVTLESTNADGKGLGSTFTEMLPQFPDLYDSGMLKMRQRILVGGFSP